MPRESQAKRNCHIAMLVDRREDKAMPKITIVSEDQRRRIQERIEELTGCREGTSEERELIDLTLAVEIWDAKHRKG
ncbi:MAG TPA: hypothetical protein VGN91_16130 [Bosea sp. (in: a-proteobacteria)]|nr:hypothetical protein [Bosea sp. (in: a-proteobacteria)]